MKEASHDIAQQAMTSLKKRRGGDPLAGFGSLQEAVRDMLASWPFGEREALSLADWTPSCNVSESVEEYRIEAELPGVKQEDVSNLGLSA